MDNPSDPGFLGRALLKSAVQRQIFDPYTGEVLDMRRAVLIDGTDYERADGTGKGAMHVMSAQTYDTVLESTGGTNALAKVLGHGFDVYDGRKLSGKGKR